MDRAHAGAWRPPGSAAAWATWAKRVTILIVDRLDVHLANHDVAATNEVTVSSSNAPALGIGWCRTPAQMAPMRARCRRTSISSSLPAG